MKIALASAPFPTSVSDGLLFHCHYRTDGLALIYQEMHYALCILISFNSGMIFSKDR